MASNKSQDFVGEILHFGSARFRVVGSGNLLLNLLSLDGINTVAMPTLVMSAATNREPTILTNFVDQRAQLEGGTTVIDEIFSISKITIFIKPIGSGYPQ